MRGWLLLTSQAKPDKFKKNKIKSLIPTLAVACQVLKSSFPETLI